MQTIKKKKTNQNADDNLRLEYFPSTRCVNEVQNVFVFSSVAGTFIILFEMEHLLCWRSKKIDESKTLMKVKKKKKKNVNEN